MVAELGLTSLAVKIGQDSTGVFTAQVVGLPEIQARAATRSEALLNVRGLIAEWVGQGKLVSLTDPSLPPMRKPSGWAEKDAIEQEFVNELARQHQEDFDRTLRENELDEEGCSSTSSTPIT